jgi:aryl-alcohol dehydrogenase-like predicted oxidoreductase
MTELALGTVAFGVDYGITNTAGAPSDDVILSILDVAHEAGVTLFDNKYEIAAYGRNITNEERLVGGIDFNNLTGFTNAPRIWGVEAKVNF